jgi:hypothetical protein
VDWSLYGPKLAQVALTVSADDVDGVSAEDRARQGPPPRSRDPPQYHRGWTEPVGATAGSMFYH